MNNLILGDINLLLATHTSMGKQELLNKLISAVDLKLVITTPSNEKVELSMGEFIEADLEAYDGETGIEIVSDDIDYTL